MNNLKVLVVDDNEDVRDLTAKWLSDAGHKVITARDGDEAVKKLTKDLNIIILDIMMPGPSPKQLLEKIKKKSPKAIVIYLSAVEPFGVTPEQERKGWNPVMEPPVMGYIQKPITKNQVLAKVEDAIKMSKILGKK